MCTVTTSEKKNQFLNYSCTQLLNNFTLSDHLFLPLVMLYSTAQGKQGIWLFTFPGRENTGNLVNLIFYTGKIVPTQGKF